MSIQPRDDDALDLQEAAEEEQLRKLEQEVEQMAQKVLEYRTTLPDQLNSSLSSTLASQRPLLPAHVAEKHENRAIACPETEPGTSQGLARNVTAPEDAHDMEESQKIKFIKEKISSNVAALPVILNRIKEYMARIDQLESSQAIVHPAFKRKVG